MISAKWLKVLVVVLLVSNVALLAFLLMGSRGGRHGGRDGSGGRGDFGPRKVVVEALGFSESQTAAYDALIPAHQAAQSELRGEIGDLRRELYASLNAPDGGAAPDSLIALIGERVAAVERLNYRHFEDVRDLTTPEQAAAFEALSGRLGDVFRGRGKRRGR